MKKIISLFVIIFLLFATVPCKSFAEENKISSFEIMQLIDLGLEDNYQKISSLSQGLSDSEKIMIFSQKKKDPTVPFIVNLLIGLGIGSFIAGDTNAGWTELIGELSGAVLIGIGSSSRDLSIIASLGALDIMIFRIGGLIRPFTFSGEYNSKLQLALLGNKTSEFISGTNESLMIYQVSWEF